MNHTRRQPSVPAFALAFWGLSLALLLAGCSKEPAPPSASAPPPPPVQSPPNLEPPSAARPAPVQEQVLMVVRDDSGRHTARVVQRQDKQVVVRDGREGPEYDRVSGVTFSADGASLAYEAQRGGAHFMVLDDREWPLTAQMVQDSFRVSPDNKRLALVARHQDQWQVMVDARPDPPFEFIFAETLKFSPNSAHTGYLALKGQKLAAVVDGQVKDQRDILAPGSKALEELLRQADDQGVPPKVEVK